MASVSAVALVSVAHTGAEAQNATPQWWASVEGQYNWVSGDAIDHDFGEVGNISVGPNDGFAGRLHFGGRIGDGWSAAGGIRYGHVSKEKDALSYYYSEFGSGDANAEYDEDHLVLDFEIGRDVGIGDGGNARIFGGLRFAHFNGDGKFSSRYSSFYGPGGSADLKSDHKFTGIGPRVGVDAAIPLAENVQADIGVAGAVLFGKRKLKVKGSYSGFYGEGSIDEKDSDKVIVPNVEASVALTYLLGQNASVSAGYRGEMFWNIMPTIDDFKTSNDDRFIHGPFLKLTIKGN